MNINLDFTCTRDRIGLDVPHQIWEALSSDSNIPLTIVRLLHNKPLFYVNNHLRCYASYLSPDAITKTFSIVGLLLFLAGLYFLARSKRKRLFLLAFLATPLLPIFLTLDWKIFIGLALYGGQFLVILYGFWSFLKVPLKMLKR